MNKLKIVAIGLCCLGLGLAQNSLSLETLLGKPLTGLSLELAPANLASAQRVQAQLQADPTTLKADLLAAQGNVDYAQASLSQTLIQSRVSLAQAFLDALLAQRKQQLDQARWALTQTELKVAQERLKLGSGNALAVEQAQTNLTQVEQDLKTDQAQLGVRLELLRGLLGQPNLPPLSEPIPAASRLPTLAETRQAALSVPAVVKAASAVVLAQLRLGQSQSEYVPQAQRNAAQQGLVAAQLEYQTQVSTAQQAAEAAYVVALGTRAQLESAQAVLATQKAAHQAALAQEKVGTVARLQVQTLELTLLQAQYSYLQAQQQAYLSGLNLQLLAPSQPNLSQGVK